MPSIKMTGAGNLFTCHILDIYNSIKGFVQVAFSKYQTYIYG
jgi:hypothetical protein